MSGFSILKLFPFDLCIFQAVKQFVILSNKPDLQKALLIISSVTACYSPQIPCFGLNPN